MSNFDTKDANFDPNLRKLEVRDRNHADVFNEINEQLIKNDVSLKNDLDEIKKSSANKDETDEKTSAMKSEKLILNRLGPVVSPFSIFNPINPEFFSETSAETDNNLVFFSGNITHNPFSKIQIKNDLKIKYETNKLLQNLSSDLVNSNENLTKKINGIKSVEHATKADTATKADEATNSTIAAFADNSEKLGGRTVKEFVKYNDAQIYFSFSVDEEEGNDVCTDFPADNHGFKTFNAAVKHCKRVCNHFGTYCNIILHTDSHTDTVFLERTKIKIHGNGHTIKSNDETNTWYIEEGYLEANDVKIHCQQFNVKRGFVTLEKVEIIKTKYNYALLYATQSNIYLKECILRGLMNDTKSYSTGCYAEYGATLTVEDVKIINCDTAISSYASNVFFAKDPIFEDCGTKVHIGQGGNIFKIGKNEYE